MRVVYAPTARAAAAHAPTARAAAAHSVLAAARHVLAAAHPAATLSASLPLLAWREMAHASVAVVHVVPLQRQRAAALRALDRKQPVQRDRRGW